MLSLFRCYLLIVSFILVTMLLTSIARAIQAKELQSPAVLSAVINSYKKISTAYPKNGYPLLIGAAKSVLYQKLISPPQEELIDEFVEILPPVAPPAELHDEITQIINQHEAEEKSAIRHDSAIGDYLLFTLFPHRKSEIVEEPIARPYEEHLHQNDLSVIRIADRIDHSLSLLEESGVRDLETDLDIGLNNDHEIDQVEAQMLDDESDEDITQDLLENPLDEGESTLELSKEFTEALTGELTSEFLEEYYDNTHVYRAALEEGESETFIYPYLPDPLEILEEEALIADFKNLPLEKQIEQLLTTGDYFLIINDNNKARQYYLQAIKLGADQQNSPAYAKALVKLADIEENPFLARFQYTHALDIYKVLNDYDMEIADILVKLVWTFDMATERMLIYDLLTQAKSILENHTYTPQYTEVLRNLAIYYETVNDFERADANYKAALALDLQHLTTNDIRTILALENYASFYLKFAELEKAEEILLFKLEAHEAVTPPDYYNLGRTQSMLGWVNLQLKNYDEALHYYSSGLGNINYSITKNRFMPHYYSLPALLDLIYLFVSTEEYEKAIPYYNFAISLLENENEAYTLDYLRNVDRDEITPADIIHYPWAFNAEVDGLLKIMEYAPYEGVQAQ